MPKSIIIGTGSYAPPQVLTNSDLEKMIDTSDEWITTRTGIRERRISRGETTSEVATKAARRALQAASISPMEIDMVISATVTPDMCFPSSACFIQSYLGIPKGIPAFDISAACSGFIYALDTADKYIRTGAAKRILVVGVDLFSKIVDWEDRKTCVLFGDGAGAVVLSADSGERGILSTHIHSDGDCWEMLYTPSGTPSNPLYDRTAAPPHIRMNGNETFKFAVRTMLDTCMEALEHNKISPDDIALFIPHQANLRIIKATKERLGIQDEKVYTNVDRYGNTSAGSIPLALDEAVKSGRIVENDLVLFAAFGGGLTWASALIRW